MRVTCRDQRSPDRRPGEYPRGTRIIGMQEGLFTVDRVPAPA
jgi:hypothetical protein